LKNRKQYAARVKVQSNRVVKMIQFQSRESDKPAKQKDRITGQDPTTVTVDELIIKRLTLRNPWWEYYRLFIQLSSSTVNA